MRIWSSSRSEWYLTMSRLPKKIKKSWTFLMTRWPKTFFGGGRGTLSSLMKQCLDASPLHSSEIGTSCWKKDQIFRLQGFPFLNEILGTALCHWWNQNRLSKGRVGGIIFPNTCFFEKRENLEASLSWLKKVLKIVSMRSERLNVARDLLFTTLVGTRTPSLCLSWYWHFRLVEFSIILLGNF